MGNVFCRDRVRVHFSVHRRSVRPVLLRVWRVNGYGKFERLSVKRRMQYNDMSVRIKNAGFSYRDVLAYLNAVFRSSCFVPPTERRRREHYLRRHL